MSRQKTMNSYVIELKKLIKARTGAECEPWLLPQIRATASNMLIADKMHGEIMNTKYLVSFAEGSAGQQKNELNPLLSTFDKMQRTLLLQFEALGLNFNTTPSKVREDAKKANLEDDPMCQFYREIVDH